MKNIKIPNKLKIISPFQTLSPPWGSRKAWGTKNQDTSSVYMIKILLERQRVRGGEQLYLMLIR